MRISGQTGAGKSSFINLLLDTDVLPTSGMSNTNTICEIHNSSANISIGAIFHPRDGGEQQEEICSDVAELKELLKSKIQKGETSEYKPGEDSGYIKVQIFFPCDILSKVIETSIFAFEFLIPLFIISAILKDYQ